MDQSWLPFTFQMQFLELRKSMPMTFSIATRIDIAILAVYFGCMIGYSAYLKRNPK